MPVYALSRDSYKFPPIELAEPDGLLAIGGDLSLMRLVSAYRNGIFPWYGPGEPILWWSPTPRCVILPPRYGKGLHVPRSVKKILALKKFTFTVNMAFDKVIANCAGIFRPDQSGTWIVPEMVEAYCALHRAGGAHSVEAWQNGELAGGLYGVVMGRAFFGESMFHIQPNASKAAFAWLAERLFAGGFEFIDCQQETQHMLRFGAELLSLERFKVVLAEAMADPDDIYLNLQLKF
jgi:leucyl/phenylalanyl-tRNA--protein transferase